MRPFRPQPCVPLEQYAKGAQKESPNKIDNTKTLNHMPVDKNFDTMNIQQGKPYEIKGEPACWSEFNKAEVIDILMTCPKSNNGDKYYVFATKAVTRNQYCYKADDICYTVRCREDKRDSKVAWGNALALCSAINNKFGCEHLEVLDYDLSSDGDVYVCVIAKEKVNAKRVDVLIDEDKHRKEEREITLTINQEECKADDKRNELPTYNGIYFVFDNSAKPSRLIYIGQADREDGGIRARHQNHEKHGLFVKEAHSEKNVSYVCAQCEADINRVENALIYKYQPCLNDACTKTFRYAKTKITITCNYDGPEKINPLTFTQERKD